MRVRFRSFRSRALLACVPATALVLMAGAGAASAAHAPANSRAALRVTIERLLSHWHPTNHGVHMAVRRGPGLKQVTSRNWAGYADLGSGFSSVAAKWTEPKISNCSTNGPLKLAVFWVGIDGFNAGATTVEQGGTGALCGQGTPLTYFTWHEMCCGQAITPFGNLTVRPGDSISASVVRSGSSYTIKVTDSTTSGNSGSSTKSCGSCANASAEWIAEAPTASTGEVPLPKFSTFAVTGAAVKAGSKSGTISSFPDYEITMNNASPHNVAKPGSLTSGGAAFKVTWVA
jgi:hypothetical protein